MKATCVIADGPFANAEPYGDEFPEWSVSLADDDGNEWETAHYRSREAAVFDAMRIAKEKRIEFVNEAGRA